ncbi:MAG: hypothetical protein KDN05_20450, partial [Verrucomicrobiae bacterium]|nr:hypothetical protein [Verrucomicrobiae bacterium]
RILQFTESGTFVRRFDAVFGFILGIVCDSSGNVHVLDRGDSKVKTFLPDGTFVRDWGGSGTGDGQFSLSSAYRYNLIAVDSNDQIFVCDPGNSRVQVFDAEGTFQRKWGEFGTLPGQFASSDPDGIVIALDQRVILSCDSSSPPIRIFDAQGVYQEGKTSPAFDSFCITPDGILANRHPSYGGIQFFDQNLTQVFSYNNSSTHMGMASNQRGDIYRVLQSPKAVLVIEREYSNVHNNLLPTAIPQPVVTNVAQRAGVPLLDIDYKITDADSGTVETAALAFLNGNNTLTDVIPMRTFLEGTAANLGAGQTVDQEKRLTWDMAADWSVDFAQIQVEVLAKDERNPLGIHWVTVPAEDGKPAFEVSRAPVSDGQLLSVWYWFIASGRSGLTFENGQVRGAGGSYGTTSFASGTTTTNNGRVFAYENLGVRGISASEMARALAGNYGISSVTEDSVVREPLIVGSLLSAWGDNSNGQTNISPGLAASRIVSLSAGDQHSMFLTEDGSLWALGRNSSGQLGDGTTTNRSTLVQVATAVSQVAAGRIHSLFIKTDGSLWAMGYNASGQLGDGTTTNRSTPVQVATNVKQVSAFGD